MLNIHAAIISKWFATRLPLRNLKTDSAYGKTRVICNGKLAINQYNIQYNIQFDSYLAGKNRSVSDRELSKVLNMAKLAHLGSLLTVLYFIFQMVVKMFKSFKAQT